MVKSNLLLLGALLFSVCPSFAIDLPSEFEDSTIISGIPSPASFRFAPDGRLFYGERINGNLRVAKYNGGTDTWTVEPTPFYTFDIPKNGGGVPEAHRSSGIRDIVFDPNFLVNGYVYVFYMRNNPRHNRVVRIATSTNPDIGQAGSEVLLLDLPFNGSSSSGSHNGGGMEFGNDGYLYITTGDGWSGGDAVQSLSTYTGKLFRIGPDGTIPTDNPFYTQATGSFRAIYALGLRNPFSMSKNPDSGNLYINDAVGSSKAQVYRVESAANYGHQGYSGIGNSRGVWTDAASAGGLLITGGAWYPNAGGVFPPQYNGTYFVALWGSNGQASGRLSRVISEADSSVVSFGTNLGQSDGSADNKPITPRVGLDGNLYYMLTTYDTSSASIHRIRVSGLPKVASPVFSPNGGNYPNPIAVTLTSSTAGAAIHYTTDGSEPTQTDSLYAAPVNVATPLVLKARAYAAGLAASNVSEANFFIGEITNVPPIASAGPDQLAARNTLVTLDGASSTDPDGDDLFLSVSWSQVAGPTVTLANADEEVPSFTPTQTGLYEFQISVSDGIDTSIDRVLVQVVTCIEDVVGDFVARYDFDEGSGTTTVDSSDNSYDGSLNGPAWSSLSPPGTTSGFSLSFDGSNDLVDVSGIDITSSTMSITAWIRINDFGGGAGDGRIISKASGVNDPDHHWMLSTIQSGGQHYLRFRLKTNGTTSNLIANAGALSLNQWLHIAAVYDGATMKLYLDGVEVGSLAKTGSIDTDINVPVSIGNQPTANRPFDGNIDQLRIYSKALIPAELLIIRNKAGNCDTSAIPSPPNNLRESTN